MTAFDWRSEASSRSRAQPMPLKCHRLLRRPCHSRGIQPRSVRNDDADEGRVPAVQGCPGSRHRRVERRLDRGEAEYKLRPPGNADPSRRPPAGGRYGVRATEFACPSQGAAPKNRQRRRLPSRDAPAIATCPRRQAPSGRGTSLIRRPSLARAQGWSGQRTASRGRSCLLIPRAGWNCFPIPFTTASQFDSKAARSSTLVVPGSQRNDDPP